jgi:hypothetical protein
VTLSKVSCQSTDTTLVIPGMRTTYNFELANLPPALFRHASSPLPYLFRARIPIPDQGDRNAVDVNATNTRPLPHTPPGPSESQNAGPSQINSDRNSSRPSLQPGFGRVGETWWARPVCETLSRAHAPDAFSRYSFHRIHVRCQQRTIIRVPLVPVLASGLERHDRWPRASKSAVALETLATVERSHPRVRRSKTSSS